MKCRCGNRFSDGEDDRTGGFALVADSDFGAFLDREWVVRERRASEGEFPLEAVLEASELVGTVRECPKCSRLMVIQAGSGDAVFYVRDE